MHDKINVGIVFGGRSGEHEVSLNSAYNVIKSIDQDKYTVTMLGITKAGQWKIYKGDPLNVKDNTWQEDLCNIKDKFSLFNDDEINSIDIFFPVLHGTFGEDGTIQGLFEMINKPYVGCGVLASSVAMDKDIAKIIFMSENIPVAGGILLYKSDILEDIHYATSAVEALYPYPVFVKPSNMGSSVGISKAHNREELEAALNDAVKYDIKIIVEEFIQGKEIEVAVLGNEHPETSCAGHVVPCHEFYDYEAKYLTGDDSEIIIPAPIDQVLSDKIRNYAEKAFKAINGSGLARVDFFVQDKTNKIYLNEINTMPGFTNISMYSKLWDASGIKYVDLIDKLIELGFERYNTRQQLIYEIEL